MFAAALFLLGFFIGATRGVFSLILVEILVNGAVLLNTAPQGLVASVVASALTSVILMGGFVVALVTMFLFQPAQSGEPRRTQPVGSARSRSRPNTLQ